MKQVVEIFLFGIIIFQVNGHIYQRCELARALLNQGFSRDKLDNWVCLVESESSRNTGVVGGPNSDGSYDYGLFQINNRYWCKNGYAGGDCNIDCNELTNDDISDDSKCTKLIYSRMGFEAWFGWIRHCKGQSLPNIQQECGF